MPVRPAPRAAAVLAGGLLTTVLVTSMGAPASATEVCDAYSGTCTTPAATAAPTGVADPSQPGSDVAGTSADNDTAGTATSSGQLPLTGGELVLLTAVGAAALAGGTVLVLAGRRRSERGTPA